MKIVEFMGGLMLPITNEEAEILGKFNEQDVAILKSNLTEREQVIANQLVNKGALFRRNQDGKITYHKQTRD